MKVMIAYMKMTIMFKKVIESYCDECVHDEDEDNVDVEPGAISPTQLPIEAHPGADR